MQLNDLERAVWSLYDPDAMASFFRKMAKKNRSGGPEWLSSHPVTSRRIEAAERRAAQFKERRATNDADSAPTAAAASVATVAAAGAQP